MHYSFNFTLQRLKSFSRVLLLLAFTLVSVMITGCDQIKAAFTPQVAHGEMHVDVSGLTQDGSYVIDSSGRPFEMPVIVIRKSAGVYSALSMRCPIVLTSTTEPCRVMPPKDGILTCFCDGSHFDYDGKLVQGPAKEPMKRLSSLLQPDGHTLLITY